MPTIIVFLYLVKPLPLYNQTSPGKMSDQNAMNTNRRPKKKKQKKNNKKKQNKTKQNNNNKKKQEMLGEARRDFPASLWFEC